MYYHPHEEEGELPFYKGVRWLALASALFAFTLLVDYNLPETQEEEVVERRIYFKESNRFGGNTYVLKLFTRSFIIQAKPDLFKDAPEKTRIRISHSPLFRTIKSVSGKRQPSGEEFNYETDIPVYRGFAAFPVSLLLLSLFTVIYRKDEVVAYAAGFITMILLVTILIII